MRQLDPWKMPQKSNNNNQQLAMINTQKKNKQNQIGEGTR
jgi:hypothetical protein